MQVLRTRLSWWSLLVFALLIPLFKDVSVKVLIAALIISFFFATSPRSSKTFDFNSSWELATYLLVLIVGLFYSSDIKSGFKVLETNFGFLAIPIIFSKIKNFGKEELNTISYFFIVGLFIACSICLGNAIFLYLETGDSQVFFFYRLTSVVDSHPTYLAYYLIFSITFGLYNLNYEKTPTHPLLSALLILFFFMILLLTGGQTAFVSLLLVFSFFILKTFLGDQSNNQKLTIGIIIIMMVTMFFVSTTQDTRREDNLNDSWDRFALWKAAINANSSDLFGVGTGDSKSVLNEYFRQHNLNEYANESLNSHNQFIQIYLSNGLIGLIALLLMFSRPLYLAFKNNSPLGILIFFPFLVYGMTEVFLGRYQGVVFFALLHQGFVSYYASSKSAFSLKKA